MKISDGEFPPGVALPVAKARMKIGGFDQTLAVDAAAKFVIFRVPLRAGPVELQTWFLDAGDNVLSGAYYVQAKRLASLPPGR